MNNILQIIQYIGNQLDDLGENSVILLIPEPNVLEIRVSWLYTDLHTHKLFSSQELIRLSQSVILDICIKEFRYAKIMESQK